MDYNQNSQNHQNNGGGQWDRWNSDSSNSSYYNQPTHKPYGQGFMVASGVCGLLSVTTCCAGILSLPLGALGILFAVLACRKGKKIHSTCVMGIVLSCIGIVSSVSMIVYSFSMLPTLLENEVFRSQFDAVSQQMYGMDFAEFMQEFYGYTFQ